MAYQLRSGIRAGIAYAATVFGIGFLLGTARVLLLAPRVGPTIAVLVETPVILAASWYVAAYWMQRLAVAAEIRTRIPVGVVAFTTLWSSRSRFRSACSTELPASTSPGCDLRPAQLALRRRSASRPFPCGTQSSAATGHTITQYSSPPYAVPTMSGANHVR